MQTQERAARLIALKTSVLKADEAEAAHFMMDREVDARLRAAGQRLNAAWEKIGSRDEWEHFRDARLADLFASFGEGGKRLRPDTPADAACDVTSTIDGDGFRVSNLVFAGQPGLPITANLYAPAAPATNMPGILLVSSHHNPKWQVELQDLGATWARSGCVVLVIDQIGYGERRQQPYGGREDYRWRYYLGMQLETVGESMMAWMVGDLKRGLDVLAGRPGVDPKRLLVVGAVAGGGHLATVLTACDPRPACIVMYGYAGMMAAKPAPADGPKPVAIGGGDFDLINCPRNSARDGFASWVIGAACAPRFMIQAHEFEWNIADDLGYARISKIYGFYGATNRLDWTHGYGQGDADGSCCNNINAYHRRKLDPILSRWFNMPEPKDCRWRVEEQRLTCLTPAARERWPVRPVHAVLAEQAARQLQAARAALAALTPDQRRAKLRADWAGALGDVAPTASPNVERSEKTAGPGFTSERLLLATEPGIRLPALLLMPATNGTPATARRPVVVGTAQEGKDIFLAKRALEVAQLLERGVGICVVDVRGVGETVAAGDRYWYSDAVDVAAREFKLGQTVLGGRVRDLRSVVRYLQSRPDVDGARLAAWGESFAPANGASFVDPPMKTEATARTAEPMGASAALLLALFEDDVRAVIGRGGLTGFAALLDGPACHVVMDAVVPRATQAGDLADVVAVLAPRPVRLEAVVDGRNRLADQPRLERDYAVARAAHTAKPDALTLSPSVRDDVAEWLCGALLARAQE